MAASPQYSPTSPSYSPTSPQYDPNASDDDNDTSGVQVDILKLARESGIDTSLCTEVDDARLKAIFRNVDVPEPPSCPICLESHLTSSPDWVLLCDQGCSSCRDCADQELHRQMGGPDSRDRSSLRCPCCRQQMVQAASGEWRRNLDRNATTLAFVAQHPNYNPDAIAIADCPNVGCTFTGTKSQMRDHIETSCFHEQVACPFAFTGCAHKCTRLKMKCHVSVFDHATATGGNAFRLLLALKKSSDDAARAAQAKSDETISELHKRVDTLRDTANTLTKAMEKLAATAINSNRRLETTERHVRDLIREVAEGRADTKLVLDRFWVIANDGKTRVPVGRGSRPGGSASQKRARTREDKLREEAVRLRGILEDNGLAAGPSEAAAGSSSEAAGPSEAAAGPSEVPPANEDSDEDEDEDDE